MTKFELFSAFLRKLTVLYGPMYPFSPGFPYYWKLNFFLKCVTSFRGGGQRFNVWRHLGGGVRDLWQFVTGGSKIAKNSVTSFMDGPLVVSGRLRKNKLYKYHDIRLDLIQFWQLFWILTSTNFLIHNSAKVAEICFETTSMLVCGHEMNCTIPF